MVPVRIKHETDINVLREVALLQDQEIRKLMAYNRELERRLREKKGEVIEGQQLELIALQELLAQREKKLFGDSSEKRNGTDKEKKKTGDGKKKQKGHGPNKQLELPIVETFHELDEADFICPKCGGQLEEWEGQFEESEAITVVERIFVKVRHMRKKYRCRCNSCIETAPGPLKLKPGSRYSPEFAVEVAIGKYVDHLPLQRQVNIMKREGLQVTAQTLWDQIETLANVLKPTYEQILQEVLDSPLVYADETWWRMMGKRKGEKKRWWMWGAASDNLVAYRIMNSRSQLAARSMLEGYEGILMADGYGVYGALARAGPQSDLYRKNDPIIELVHCWAHVRRKFIDIEVNYPEECGEILDLIGELYDVEREVRGIEDTLDRMQHLRELRYDRSRFIVEQIRQWAETQRALPRSGLGKAIAYMKSLWPGLTAFLKDPRIPLDNNHIERALRAPVVGRKNHYGSRSKRGTEVTALFYTLVESAKLSGVEPKEYLLRATWTALKEPEMTLMPYEILPA